MEDITNTKLAEAMDYLANAIKTGADFVYKQATGFVREVLNYEIIQNVAKLICIVVGGSLVLNYWPNFNYEFYQTAKPFAQILFSLICLKFIYSTALMAAKPWVAPRLVVLDWVTNNSWRFK